MPLRMKAEKHFLEDGELRIKLAAADEGAAADPLVADRPTLAAFSSCVRGLPSEAVEWDISQLLIEGQPVQRQTVVRWLNLAYSQALDEPFEQDTEPHGRMTGLAQLLAFADAVGSTRGMLRACLSDLGAVIASATVPASEGESGGRVDAATALMSSNSVYFWANDFCELHKASPRMTLLTVRNDQERVCVAQQVATQTEQLLYLAHKLQLPALQQKMHNFLRANTFDDTHVLYGHVGRVLTDRVLEAAADKQQLAELVINNILTERCGFSDHLHAEQVLEPLDLTDAQGACMMFQARLTRDAFGYAQGEAVPVKLWLLDEEEPSITIGDKSFVVQLLVGSPIWDKWSKEQLMGDDPAAVETDTDSD